MLYDIIYEDNNLLVVNKPAGISVHPDAHRTEGTLIQAVREKYPEAELAHRLDKDTSGLILIAKNQIALEYLKRLFKERNILKRYFALVVGEVKKDEDIIKLGIVRSTKDFRKHVATKKMADKAREAETHYKVLKRYAGFTPLEPAISSKAKDHKYSKAEISVSKNSSALPLTGFTLLEVSPKTGRTHQIRSHLSAIGHPVVCDSLYGGKQFVCPASLTRQFLHAYSLEFATIEGNHLRLEADLPEDLNRVLVGLAK